MCLAPSTAEPFIDLCDDVIFEPDLMMECVEDELSEKQVEAHAAQQSEYNLAVETIRQAHLEEEQKRERQQLKIRKQLEEQEKLRKELEVQRKLELMIQQQQAGYLIVYCSVYCIFN